MIQRDAALSHCGRYRYALARWWTEYPARLVLWVMLNPSTADATIDDRTIGRCIGFSQAWGFDGLMVGNLFAYRATNPDELLRAVHPAGPFNSVVLRNMASTAELIVAGWGSHAAATPSVVEAVLRDLGKPVHCLGRTKAGNPRHPLYMPADSKLEEYAICARGL